MAARLYFSLAARCPADARPRAPARARARDEPQWQQRALTPPADITDPVIAKAFAHPMRIRILDLLENRVATPGQLAAELDAGLSLTSYHVRQLKKFGLVRLVGRGMQRGAVEHYYTAVARPTIPDAAWHRIPQLVRRGLIDGKVARVGNEMAAAAEHGGFDREAAYVARTRRRLSQDGWRRVHDELTRSLERIEAIAEADREACAELVDAEVIEATAVHMFFESPPPASFDSADPSTVESNGDFEGLTARGNCR